MKFLRERKIQITIIIFLTVIAYSNIFKNSFVFDDNQLIVGWPYHHSFKYIPSLFSRSIELNSVTGTYRPLRGVFFMISYKLFSEQVVLYHLVSLSVHLAGTILVYLIAEDLLARSGRAKKNSDLARWLPFLASVLFGLHPVHTEAITFITASFDTIGSVFMLLAFYFYLKSGAKNSKYYVLSVISAFVAIFTYESTITLFLLIAAYEFVFGKINKKIIAYIAIDIIYFFTRVVVGGVWTRGEYLSGSFYLTMLTMVKAVLKYITLLIFPYKLSLDQSVWGIKAHFETMPDLRSVTTQSIFDLPVLGAIFVIIFFVAFGLWVRKKLSLVSFSIFWFFICLLPFLFIVPQGNIMQERYIYVASFGFCLVVGYALVRAFSHSRLIRRIGLMGLIGLICFYGGRTYVRNRDWKNEEAHWLSQANNFPDDLQANYITASNFGRKGDLDSAVFYYGQVLKVDTKYPPAYFNLGKIYQVQGKFDEAVSNFNNAVSFDPNFFDAQIELAKLGKDNGWKEFTNKTLLFYYPSDWVVDLGKVINLKNRNNFNIQMKTGELKSGETMKQYIDSSEDTFGKLQNQELAQVSNFDEAYAKLWTDNNVRKLQLFLFKGSFVAEIVVWPPDSADMNVFEKIVQNLVINP